MFQLAWRVSRLRALSACRTSVSRRLNASPAVFSGMPGTLRHFSTQDDGNNTKKDADGKTENVEDDLEQKKKKKERADRVKDVKEELPEKSVPLEDSELADDLDEAVPHHSLVRASVPEFVPEVIAVPIDRRPVFPGFYKTFSVKDAAVAAALTRAMRKGRPYVGLFLARERDGESPEQVKDKLGSLSDIHEVGTFAQLVNVIPMEEGGVTAIVYPHRRVRALELLAEANAVAGLPGVSRVRIENLPPTSRPRRTPVIQALMQEIFVMLSEIAKLNPFFREHITHHNVSASIFEDPGRLADFCAVLTSGEAAELQELLEAEDLEERLRRALVLLKKEVVAAELQSSIRKDVEAKMNKKQREYLLLEQLKIIKKELGLETDPKERLTETFRARAKTLAFPTEVQRVFEEELSKLSVLEPAGAEFNVTRNYLEWLTSLPWGRVSKDSFDLKRAAAVLDAEHHGLEDVKARILEFIAVARLRGGLGGKILCLVGPPGVGKTSIGKSVAKALGREYFRLGLGGLSDVAELKGHRRTYVGAMPGKAVQALKRTQTQNPLILLDEVDKIGRGGHHGDPSGALLELLDPEQNAAFLDHYLDVPIDLSSALFLCTANTTETIPPALLDRMEVVRLAGYVDAEKRQIARQHLLPRAATASGLDPAQVTLTDEALGRLISQYCRESGVRNLRQQLERLCRKAALRIVKKASDVAGVGSTESEPKAVQESDQAGMVGEAELKGLETKTETATSTSPETKTTPTPSEDIRSHVTIDAGTVRSDLGSAPYPDERLYGGSPTLPAGVVTGLAWTPMGGCILYMETLLEQRLGEQDKKGSLIRTGQLGKVMEESASIAYSYAKYFISSLAPEVDATFFQHAAIHLHVPEGATPKDGPSAGTAITTALLSLALRKPIPSDVAMTGEISLTGKVMRIGGVKEKVIAAKQSGIRTVILPAANKADWEDLPAYVKEGLEARFVEEYPEVARMVGLLPAQ